MAGSKDNDALIGCGALIALGIVISIVSFVLEHWEFFLGTAVVVGALTLCARGIKAHRHRTVRQERARIEPVERARRTGEENMRTAWIRWQLQTDLPPQSIRPPAAIREKLNVTPKADWDVARLRAHGRAVWALRDAAGATPLFQEVEAHLDRVAAMLSDKNDQEFDTGSGQTDDHYLYHPDREVRTAYLEGGAQGVEAIMDSITAARARAREDAAAKTAADALAHQRNAALKALRETQHATEARDAEARKLAE